MKIFTPHHDKAINRKNNNVLAEVSPDFYRSAGVNILIYFY